MFDERSADLYYKRRGQRQLLEILDGNPARAIELADARLADDPGDAESHFIRAVALTQLDQIDEAEAAMQAALDAGMPFGRFLAGPRDLLAPLAATATFALHAASPQNDVVHGPMLGAVTDTTAGVWIRTAEETPFEVVATADGERHTATGATAADRDYTGTATLAGLSPDTTYSYQVLVDAGTPPTSQAQSKPPSKPESQSSTYTLRTAPSPGTPGTVTIAFGGCAGYTPANERMWDTIAAHSPQALLLLGDNVYVDLPEQPGPFHDYTYYQRQSRPEFRRLVSATPVYAVWDDHDAAVDDIWLGPYVDRPAWKQPMIEHFRRNWNNPDSGSASHPGVWSRFSLGDVDFFLLDGRTYRTNPFVEERTMLGPEQKAWLLDGLSASEATFKVIASPVAWADGAKPGSRDTWSGFPEEREEIFRFVEESDVTGVVLLSSDRHRSEAWTIERESGYAFYDLLSGQLTNIHTHPVEPGALFSYNLKDSFGLLTFETAEEEPRVTYEIYSIDDELVETLVIPHSDLAVSSEERRAVMSRAAGTVFSLGARVFRPACRTEPRSGVGRRRSGRRLRRRRFKAAFGGSGSEDPRTQRAAVAAAFLLLLVLAACSPPPDGAPPAVETTALWLFDEPAGLYPSHTLDDMSDHDMVLTLGLGAQIAPGHYGNALLLAPLDPPLDVPPAEEKPGEFGLARLPPPEGRTVEPLSWFTAHFAALMTSGENHLRKQVGHKNPTTSALNLGDFDWAVEFWHSPGDAAFGGSRPEGRRTDAPTAGEAVVFEIGTGPRGENDIVTQLRWSADRSRFTLVNQPAGASIDIPTADATPIWRHYAFTYDATTDQLRHYVDGALQPLPPPTTLQALPEGDEAYFTLGTDALWNHRLAGLLDEFRVSRGLVYTTDFDAPATFGTTPEPVELTQGPPLLFADSAGASAADLTDTDAASNTPLHLATRKHLFIDDALLADTGDATFTVNPPRRAERVLDNIKGTFRKHLTVASGDDGVIRIYNSREEDHLAVYTSTDGVHFDRPDQGRGEINGHRNIVIPDMVGGLGTPFWDPQAPPDERWKYLTDYQRRGLYLYTSADGYDWTRRRNIVLPFRSGTQSSTYYDDQRQVYMSYHRSGIFHTPGGVTQRSSVVTEHEDLRVTQPFQPLTQQEYLDLRAEFPLRDPLPWWVDNGPLTPGGFGMEYPHLFDPTPEDPVGTDFYLTKAMKYPYAPDTYLAFPVGYFHYYGDGPEARRVLGLEERGLGSGPLESQIAVSRDGLDWKRHPEPAYVGIGRHQGRDVVTAYIGHGMIRRGEELWQYYFGETHYHSPHTQDPDGRGVYRLVQRLDGFISLDSPYGHETTVVTRPLTFEGDRLQLNVDTDAVGYLQVGFLDEQGQPIEGYTVDDCVYVNGDFIAKEVDWLEAGADVSPLAGRTVQVVFRMRGAKLYAMQFVEGG